MIKWTVAYNVIVALWVGGLLAHRVATTGTSHAQVAVAVAVEVVVSPPPTTTPQGVGVPVPRPRIHSDYMSQPYFRESVQDLGRCVTSPIEEFIYNTFFSTDTPVAAAERFVTGVLMNKAGNATTTAGDQEVVLRGENGQGRLTDTPVAAAERFFVEVGPCDWDTSNSRFLQDTKGWRGILIEPSPNTLHSLKRKRVVEGGKVSVVARPICGKRQTTVTYMIPEGNGCGTIEEYASKTLLQVFRHAKREKMECAYLENVTKGIAKIDFLMIMTGSEWAILNDYDFNKKPVAVLAVGYSAMRAQMMKVLIGEKGFVYAQKVGHTDVLYHPSFASLHPDSPHRALIK